MSKCRLAVVGFFLLVASMLSTGAATAAPAIGFTTTALNLRAGPGTIYPVIATMRAGDQVTIYGCLSDWSWCDIDWRGYRGWAAGRYLVVLYEDRRFPILTYGYRLNLPFLIFQIVPYWTLYYHDRSFFNDIQRYERYQTVPKPPQPVVPQPVVPQPVVPKPVAPLPVVPKPAAPKPVAPQPVAPQPVVPQPVVPQPVTPQPVVPQPKVQPPKAPQPTAQQPQAVQPTDNKPKTVLPKGKQPCPPGQVCP